ncbi:MAG: hypothetical protein K8R85_11735 [Bacteroidetes bacterium]|nr:hypothetical protein [Bacteroidota bacterium]
MENIVTIIVTILLIAAFPTCKAQNDSTFNKNNSKNVVSIEALGNGFNYSGVFILGTLNYERNVIYSKKVNYSIRMGLGYNSSSSKNPYSTNNKKYSFYSLPLMFNIISNPYGNHHIDAGLGIVLTNDGWVDNINFEIGYTGSFKYRYQKKTRGVYFSSGWTPSIYFDPYFKGSPTDIGYIFDRITHLATIGISIGYHF